MLVVVWPLLQTLLWPGMLFGQDVCCRLLTSTQWWWDWQARVSCRCPRPHPAMPVPAALLLLLPDWPCCPCSGYPSSCPCYCSGKCDPCCCCPCYYCPCCPLPPPHCCCPVYLDHCVPLEVVLKALQLQLQHRREVIKQHSLARILHTGRHSTHRRVHTAIQEQQSQRQPGGPQAAAAQIHRTATWQRWRSQSFTKDNSVPAMLHDSAVAKPCEAPHPPHPDTCDSGAASMFVAAVQTSTRHAVTQGLHASRTSHAKFFSYFTFVLFYFILLYFVLLFVYVFVYLTF